MRKFGYGKILQFRRSEKAEVNFEKIFSNKKVFIKVFKIYTLIFLIHSSSVRIDISNSFAFFSLLPGFSPTIRKSVLFEIALEILAPFCCAKCLASSLDSLFKLPVKTKFLFEKKLFDLILFKILLCLKYLLNLDKIFIVFFIEKIIH